ncbi:MAG: methylenetetrahydrofolate--tRNA-(uracil(54)-C(5))-methyltransferase (FADH(2)-oxidizing) TrmFO [Bdellovibrionales bacterium]|nr:methylenetetrahydrofolate--tRNA-(uracil(54)-C(5))-methyltransferase (FADH(2)-oxidizing) TrmFO [Bdellovibrionales bacterium]
MSFGTQQIHIVGAGLAGSECAYQLAEMGYNVVLHEMRETTLTPAHKTGLFAELVCSNSLGSQTDYSAPGQLKWEAERLHSLVLRTAEDWALPAGMALAVDRLRFSQALTEIIRTHPRIQVVHQVVENFDQIPRPAVIATGPLTHGTLATAMSQHFASEFLYFFDAIAPVIDRESLNFDIVWTGDRWGKGTGDYLNCPLNREQYEGLVREILAARKVEPRDFEKTPYFDGCMPIEVMAERGPETLRFGPLSPKGLPNPRSPERPYAVVQLRQDNKEGTAYNLVGFQTKMAYPEQQRVFRLIPGLEEAEFLKLGSMHRNLFINSPQCLNPNLSSRHDPSLFFAGQITGVEGYFESTCMGLLVAHFLNDHLKGRAFLPPPRTSALGSLLHAITEPKDNFQPTNINFGLMPDPPMDRKARGRRRNRREVKRGLQIEVARREFTQWLTIKPWVLPPRPHRSSESGAHLF